MTSLVIRTALSIGIGIVAIWLTERMSGDKSPKKQDDAISVSRNRDEAPRA